MNGTECRPQAPVAEGGSEIVRVAERGATGGTDGTGSPGAGGVRAASGRLKSNAKLFNAFVLIRAGLTVAGLFAEECFAFEQSPADFFCRNEGGQGFADRGAVSAQKCGDVLRRHGTPPDHG